LNKAISSFDDAFLALKIVENKIVYQGSESLFPHDTNYRYKEYLTAKLFAIAGT